MRNVLFSDIKHFRYERKFYIEGLRYRELESLLKFHPALFREIYHRRTVNNIYFDTLGLHNYFDNVNGVDRRLKVRIRWYGDLFGLIENPTLELKLKHNLHVGKLLYPLKGFTFDNDFSIDIVRRIFAESSLGDVLKLHLMGLNFSLLNSYSRKYYISADHKFRITLDTDMEVYKLSPYRNNFLCNAKDYINTILELKYNKPHDEDITGITNHLPFRMTRSSKYIDGIARLYI